MLSSSATRLSMADATDVAEGTDCLPQAHALFKTLTALPLLEIVALDAHQDSDLAQTQVA